MGQEWDGDPETMINQSAPTAAQDPQPDSSGAVADDDDGSFSPELFDEDEVRQTDCLSQRSVSGSIDHNWACSSLKQIEDGAEIVDEDSAAKELVSRPPS